MSDHNPNQTDPERRKTRLEELDEYADAQTTYNLVTLAWSLALGAGIGLPALVLLSLMLLPGRVTISTGTYWIMGIGFLLFWPLHFLRRHWLKRYEALRKKYKQEE